MIGSPSTGPYFVTSSTGGVTTSPVSGFLIPGLPGTSSSLPFGALDQIHLYVLEALLQVQSVQSRQLHFVTSVVGSPRSTTSPVSGSTLIGVVVVDSPSSPFVQ